MYSYLILSLENWDETSTKTGLTRLISPIPISSKSICCCVSREVVVTTHSTFRQLQPDEHAAGLQRSSHPRNPALCGHNLVCAATTWWPEQWYTQGLYFCQETAEGMETKSTAILLFSVPLFDGCSLFATICLISMHRWNSAVYMLS